MKTTILSRNQSELLENLLAKHGQVVTNAQVQAEAQGKWGRQQANNRISQLVKNGWLVRIKRGLYAIADLSSRGFLSLSPYAVAHLLVGESYVSFEAALSYHGMFDQLTQEFTSVSLRQYKTVELGAVRYRFIKTKQSLYYGWQAHTLDNQTAQIATVEKALVDMVQFRQGKYAVDVVIEKLRDYEDSLDKTRLLEYLSPASKATVKIFGLIFDFLELDTAQLYSLVKGSKSTHWISKGDQRFSAKWRLYYDEYFDKYQLH